MNSEISVVNSLNDKCLYLTQLLQNAQLRDFQSIFPSLVKSIFGFPDGTDWGLLTLQKNIPIEETDNLRRLLAPDGPFLKMVFKFTEEVDCKFEFPIACVPAPSQRMLKEGKMSDLSYLYANILKLELFPSTLQLTAFEFYFFHFTYFIVNPKFKNSVSYINIQDTMYARILEDYLNSFLPISKRNIPQDVSQYNVQHSSIASSSLSEDHGGIRGSSNQLQFFNSPAIRPGRPSFLQVRTPKSSFFKKEVMQMVAALDSNSPYRLNNSPTENLMSETFILILKEMYLNQMSFYPQNTSLVLMPKTVNPSLHHVWIVRIIIKHLHLFFNNALSSNQSYGHGKTDSLRHLKSLGITQLIQKEVYCFLKCVLGYWPLDDTFRVPLEAYLSYIRPWKYSQCASNPSFSRLDSTVWQKFVTENLLFYTTIFQQVLRRFLLMDLSYPKNAHMLFRLTKFICTSTLRDMILQAERNSLSKSSNLGTSTSIIHTLENVSLYKSSLLEMSGLSYHPLFSESVFHLVTQLLTAIHVAQKQVTIENATVGNTNRSFKAKACSSFESSDDGINSDDNTLCDSSKTASYLGKSTRALSDFFREILPPAIITPAITTLMNSPSNANNRTGTEDNILLHELSTADRIQMIKGRKKLVVTYNGNPDLQPVRTYEIAGLVRLFNGFSQQINDQYATEIHQIYCQNSLIGKMCRRILSKPVTYYDVQKSKAMTAMTRTPVYLAPRVNLRILADRNVLANLFVYLFIMCTIGFPPLVSILLFFGVSVFLLFIFSIIFPVPIHPKKDLIC